MSLNPFESSAKTNMSVPAAFRVWSCAVSAVGVGCLQVGHIAASDVDDASKETALVEVYSRAVYETLFALHFDREDTRVDVHVSNQICDLFDQGIEHSVRDRFLALGGRHIVR